MKITVSFFVLSVLSVLFYSCKTDGIISSGPSTGSYEWTSTPITYGEPYDVQVIDRNNYYVYTSTGLYKVTNDIPSLFTVNSSVFKAEAGYVYDDTYIVYTGRKVSDNKPQFMIFDNGAYTIYDMPDSNLSVPYFESRGKFYCAHYFFPNYYKFDNGTFTFFSLDADHASFFAKANGNMYLFAITANPLSRKIFRITDSGLIFIREEAGNNYLHILNNAIISVSSSPGNISYFSESGWINMFTLPALTESYFTVIKGENANAFTVVRQDTAFTFTAGRWNGTSYNQLTNIPATINFYHGFYHIDSRFRDNTFYLLVRDGEIPKIIKGTYSE